MKILRCIIFSFLLGYGLVAQAAESVYAYTTDDGTVSLSNVPADDRYRVLVVEQHDIAPAAPAAVAVPAKPAAVAAVARPAAIVQKSHNLRFNRARYKQIVDDTARSYGVDSALLHAVISVESRYDPKIVSKTGAVGLMQLMPETAKRYGVADSFDAAQNVQGGAQYLRDLLLMFDNDMSLALAAYNAGEYAVIKHGNRIPPFRETKSYVPKVMGYYWKYRKDL